MLIFKATIFPYPRAALPMEIIVCFFVVVLNSCGCLLEMRGNLTENVKTMLFGVILVFIAGVGALYYMWLQTYVVMLDLAFSAVFLGINAIIVLGTFWATQRASSKNKVPQIVLQKKKGQARLKEE